MSVLRVLICYLVILAIFGCGGHRPVRQRVLLPPTLNLVPHHNIGLFEFSVENGKGNLQQFATQRFEEYVLAAQSGIEMREFTSADSARVFSSSADSNTTPVAFFGHLKISNVKPHGGLTAGLSPVMRATVTVELSVGLRHARTVGRVAPQLRVDRRSGRPLVYRRPVDLLGARPDRRVRAAHQSAGIQCDLRRQEYLGRSVTR